MSDAGTALAMHGFFNSFLEDSGGMPNLEISDELKQKADAWPVYESTYQQRIGGSALEPVLDTVECRRCQDCHEVIYVSQGVIGHLLTSHGFRMDGRRWDNENREI